MEAWLRRRGLLLVVRRRRGTALLERTTPALVFLLLIDPLLSGLGRFFAVDDEEFARRTTNPGCVIALLALTVGALVFASLMFALFRVFGTLAVEPSVVESRVGREPPRGQLFGIQLPVTDALVQVSLFLAMFSGLYFAASAATDPRAPLHRSSSRCWPTFG